ncbi:kelch-like protein 12 [Amphiura filiformis]|uniref:kelch-like protein 12 n=1 Tax=Amphiura filiformis TaxID=82378 RepID=UPI003B213071
MGSKKAPKVRLKSKVILKSLKYYWNMLIRKDEDYTEVAFEILEMACYMQFTDIYQYCSQFMELNKFDRPLDKINMEDCFKLYQLAKCHGDLKDIVEKSLRYMCQNIQDLKETKYFMEMASSSFLDDFLRRPDLSSEDEEKEVLEMVINWLKHDWDKRHPHALSLLQQIRLGHVSEESLTTLLDADILKIPDCQRLLEKTLKLQKSEESKVNRSLDYPDLFATRSTITAPIALSFGGLFDTQDSDLDEPWQDKCQLGYFDVDIKEWKLLKQFAAPQHLGSLVVANRTLYAVGGNEDDMTDIGHVTDPYGKQLLEYDAELNKWKSLPPMENDHEVVRLQW